MKTKKRLFVFLLVFCMVLTLMPMTAFAADTHKVAIRMQQYGMGEADEEGVVSNKYYLVDQDGGLESKDADENNYNIYYDEASNRLTIQNLQISSDKSLLVPGGTTIEVLGTNQIAMSEIATGGGGIGVVSDGDITITGSGSLYISSAAQSGIGWATQNNDYDGAWPTGGLQIIGDVNLTIDHMGATTCIGTHQGDIVIGGNAEVHLNPCEGESKGNNSIAFFNGENITIQDNAKVYSSGGLDSFDFTGKNQGKIKVNGSSEVTITVMNEEVGRAMHASGGIEVAEDAKVNISSNTKDSQVVASNGGDIVIAGEVQVNMLNKSSERSIALYAAQNIEVTGKLAVDGGIYALYVAKGNHVDFNGADVKVSNCKVGVASEARITDSIIEMNTTLRAFGTTTNVSLTDKYMVFAGKDAGNANLQSHEGGLTSPEVWGNAYVRIEQHVCNYDQKVISDKYKATDATCKEAATYYYSCTCGAKGTETFKNGEVGEHIWSDWTITKEAAADEPGSREKSCTVCGYKVTENIPATGADKPVTDTDSPETGDDSSLPAWITLAFVGGGSALALTVKGRKRIDQ